MSTNTLIFCSHAMLFIKLHVENLIRFRYHLCLKIHNSKIELSLIELQTSGNVLERGTHFVRGNQKQVHHFFHKQHYFNLSIFSFLFQYESDFSFLYPFSYEFKAISRFFYRKPKLLNNSDSSTPKSDVRILTIANISSLNFRALCAKQTSRMTF